MGHDYQNKFVTPEAAALLTVRDGDWVDYGFGAGFPELMDRALAARKGKVRDVKIRGGLVIRPRIEVVEQDPEQESFTYYSWHIGDYERKLQARGLVKFLPVMLRSLPYLYRDKHIRCDVAFVPVSIPDDQGYCGLGISNYAWRTIFESARTVVFEINEHLPRLQGVDGSHRVHLSEADYIVEGEHEPLPKRSYREPSETDIQIAKLVVEEIPDGAVLSLGVGGVPFTVAKLLAESDRKELGCHTGTISDAFLELWKAGKLTNVRKKVDLGYSTWNLAMGSQELYDWLDAEPQLFHPGDLDYVHSVERISQMSNVISINGGVEVDLMGQENGESAGTRQLSGIGGQMDFLEGAYRSRGGKGFVCLNATHKKKDGTLKSNIVPCIAGGSTVSAPRTMIQYVATEYGIAKLSGKTLRERAEAMAAIAHPDFREELLQYAQNNFS
jgi:acyl-CoA hydrolase